jgi:diguanylate cyclase (GGDEF)-like protein/PAS domain S-box-containing protein
VPRPGDPLAAGTPRRHRSVLAAGFTGRQTRPRHCTVKAGHGPGARARRLPGPAFRRRAGIDPRHPSDSRQSGGGDAIPGPAPPAARTATSRPHAAAPVGLWNVDLGAPEWQRTAQYDRIFGYDAPVPDWGFERFLDHVVPEDREQAARAIREGVDARTAWSIECRIVRRDGAERWLRIHGDVLTDATGAAVRLLGSVVDITDQKHVEASARQLANRLATSLDSMSDSFYTLDRDWRFTFVNRHAERMLERRGDELLGRIVWEAFPATVGTAIEREYRRAMEDDVTVEFEFFYDPLGICFRIRAYPSAQGLAVYFRDVTEQRRAADALRESGLRIKRLNRVYAMLSQVNALIVRKSGRDELFREACRVAVELGEFRIAWVGLVERGGERLTPVASAGDVGDFFERAPHEVFDCGPDAIGRAARVLRERRPQVVDHAREGSGVPMGDCLHARGIGSFALIPLVVHGEAVAVIALYASEPAFFDDAEMRLLQELAGNISLAIENIDSQELLDYLAWYDPLTGLANRRLFLDRVSGYVRSAASGGHQLAVVLVDLERFKNINDSLGQAAGDAILKQVAVWMARQAGDHNLLARVGSNHFAAVLPRMTSARGLVSLMERAVEGLVGHPFAVEGAMLRMAAKAGAAIFPDDGTSAETLFQNAEAALKHAKANGDRYLLHSSAMTEAIAGKLGLENRLRRALDNQEFVLHYQPKVQLASGMVTSAEALIRWNDPDNGLVPPGEFIPVLEETGLIHQVGRWAMRQAISDYLRWRDAGLPAVRIAVNVSSLQLRSGDFASQVEQVLACDPRAAPGLEMEITESIGMGDIDRSIATLQAIRALGVTVALDDFGTGFSSLTHLARLPIDTLKIDRAFIAGMDATVEGQALVSMIVTLAHSLRRTVVAEGVETAEQARLLASLGCDEMQGFHFARPVAAGEFEARYLAPSLAPAG